MDTTNRSLHRSNIECIYPMMKTAHILHKISFRGVLDRVIPYNCAFARRIYWNLSAGSIDRRWGTARDDYSVVRAIISGIPGDVRILDIGCGSGRLFPLYESCGVAEVVAQDISWRALNLARRRGDYQKIRLVNVPIEALDYPPAYFDLIISNRVMQHVRYDSIASTVKAACRLGKSVYVNELSVTDGVSESSHLFMHDYETLFASCGFAVKEAGRLGKQTWHLFTKTPLHS